MTTSDCMMIIAVILGPVIAVQLQKFIERWREVNGRKLAIFKALMATRATPVSLDHVQALNMIDLEFYGTKSNDKAVTEAWKNYLDHLNNGPKDFDSPSFNTRIDAWSSKNSDYLADLLYAMAQDLGYKFDKVQLKRGAYYPQGHVDIEQEQTMLRRGIAEIVLGKKALPISVIQSRET